MRILVTGRDGQVARALAERAGADPSIELVLVGRPDMDLADPGSVHLAIAAERPDVVVSAAAYTAVDLAEDDARVAFAVNAEGAGAVAAAAAEVGAPVIHLSTDYVFDGTKDGEYVETDPTAPCNVYGRSKLAGEQAVAATNPRHVILRTAWVYSPFGKNFVRTMLRLAETREEVSVVSDQWGNPTSAHDIADGILRAAATVRDSSSADHFGIYHLAGGGATNWAGFARRIFELSAGEGGPAARVRDIATSDYPTRAARPGNSRLSCEKFARHFGRTAPQWPESVAAVVRRLIAPKPQAEA